MTPPKPNIKRADWVVCKGSPGLIGIVRRVAKDNSWCDVDWGGWKKRMKPGVLEIKTSIPVGFSGTAYDPIRAEELREKNS